MSIVNNNLVALFAITAGSKIGSIPEQLSNLVPSELLQKDAHGNDTCVINNIRVSTSICFTDGVNLAVWGRPNELQANTNNVLDSFGAVAYNNASLPFKLAESFLEVNILSVACASGFAVEMSEGDEKGSIMSASVVHVTPDDLQLAASDKVSIMTIAAAKQIPNEQISSKLHVALASL